MSKKDGAKMPVYHGYGVAELSDQYNPRHWSQNYDASTSFSNEKSFEARRNYNIYADLSYGVSADEKLDVLVGSAVKLERPAPVYVFFHGGGWSRGTKQSACYSAEMVLERGGIFVAVNFSKIDTVSLAEIVRQSQSAVAWVYKNIADYGGSSDQIYVCGKSSGAQQAGMVLMADWKNFGLPENTIKGTILVSGAYDLEPLSLTERRAAIGLNQNVVEALSPARNIGKLSNEQVGSLILAYAENDSDEIKRQSIEFGRLWREAGFICAVIEEEGVDHFSIGEPMSNPNSALGRATLALMGL